MTEQDPSPQFSTAEFQTVSAPSHGYFARALLFGLGGALVGLALYSAVVIFTGYEIGLVSLAVGYIVGKCVLAGSGGRTGRRYQVTAALLTYFAVATSAVPVALVYFARENNAATAPAPDVNQPVTENTAATPAAGGDDSASPSGVSLVTALVTLLGIGLAAPFLQLQDMPGGLISLLILAFGIQIAWKTTGRPPETASEVLAQAGSSPDEPPTSLNLSR